MHDEDDACTPAIVADQFKSLNERNAKRRKETEARKHANARKAMNSEQRLVVEQNVRNDDVTKNVTGIYKTEMDRYEEELPLIVLDQRDPEESFRRKITDIELLDLNEQIRTANILKQSTNERAVQDALKDYQKRLVQE